MQAETPTSKAKIIKIQQNPLKFHLQELTNKATIQLHLSHSQPQPGFYHLLKQLSDAPITYEITQKSQVNTGFIYLNNQNILELLNTTSIDDSIKQCTNQSVYEKDQIIECYVMKVECLKLKLFLIDEGTFVTFYFTELRLPKVSSSHPKQIWQDCQQYFNEEILGSFVQVKINGSQTYRDQLNIHGQILRLIDGCDIKQQILKDGYADISKNCHNYVSKAKIQMYEQIVKKAKTERNGIWKKEIIISKQTNPIFEEQKYTKWEQLYKQKTKYQDLKNAENEVKKMINELKANSGAKADPTKNKIILETAISLFQPSINDKVLLHMEEFIKICSTILCNLQVGLGLQTENLDFLKYLNKIMIFFIFYMEQIEKVGTKNKIKIGMVTELEKCIKVIFKCCFLGNDTFHKKVFHKNVESDFQKFSYDPAYLSGISSYSEMSDIEQSEKPNKSNKVQKRIVSGQTKIRMNSTLLLSLIFKNYPSLVENHWEICIKSNVLTQDFINYLQKLKITTDPTKMTEQEKRNIAALMRTNFGDYSLILLAFFEQNAKVKINAINVFITMISNFQGKKMIDTTQAIYIEKLLKQTKSSYIPKSYIIFSGLKNALYFMLFSLHHEKNIQIIVNTFKALTQLCQQSTLIDKMGFMQGMGLLLSNYILPVLKFPWQIIELGELKSLCVAFLGALVNSKKKWQQVQNEYLLKVGKDNINYCMIEYIQYKEKKMIDNKKETALDKIMPEITQYFMKMSKRYYSAIFFEILPGKSVWSAMSSFYMKYPTNIFTSFIEQIFKCHFDHLTLIKSEKLGSRRVVETVGRAQKEFDHFLSEFFARYGQIITNDNYISLINILTYISYDKWNQKSYEAPKQFLLHCFDSLSDEPKNEKYPSIQSIKNNSLVRLALIKLLGYLSFCQCFQTSKFCTSAVRNLIKYSRSYKSLNSVVKITWGISNWCNIQVFKESLQEDELKQCVAYMIQHSQSDKEKIASNCTRGIGFYVKNFYKNFNMDKCIEAIIRNLSHQIIKVRINSTKTFRSLVAAKLPYKRDQQLITILEQNLLKNNYHLQTETLLLIKQLDSPIKPEKMVSIYGHILKDLCSYTTMQYEFSQIKTLKQLRRSILEEIVKMDSFEHLKNNEMTIKEFYQSVQNYIVDEREEYLRKKAEQSQILERGFEKGEQALNTVFNIKKQNYDEEKTISTQFTLNSLEYQAHTQEDIELLSQIKKVAIEMKDRGEQWRYLSEMIISGNTIRLGKI